MDGHSLEDSGQKVDGAVGSSEVSLGKGLSARLTGGSVQCPVRCWMEGCSFLLPVGSTHPQFLGVWSFPIVAT